MKILSLIFAVASIALAGCASTGGGRTGGLMMRPAASSAAGSGATKCLEGQIPEGDHCVAVEPSR